MEYIHPQHPGQRVGGSSNLSHDSNCRMDEITRAMWESTSINSPQFSFMNAEELLRALLSEPSKTVVVDGRHESEREGGHIHASVSMATAHNHDCNIPEIAAHWRAGKNVVIYCTRSISRAPAVVHRLIRYLKLHSKELQTDQTGRIERIFVLKGGICEYLGYVMQLLARSRGSCESDVSSFVADFDQSMWLFSESPAGGQVAHISEFPAIAEERKAAKVLADSEISDELSFLVEQGCCLSSAASTSMPYIS